MKNIKTTVMTAVLLFTLIITSVVTYATEEQQPGEFVTETEIVVEALPQEEEAEASEPEPQDDAAKEAEPLFAPDEDAPELSVPEGASEEENDGFLFEDDEDDRVQEETLKLQEESQDPTDDADEISAVTGAASGASLSQLATVSGSSVKNTVKKLAVPKLLKTQADAKGITVQWKGVKQASGYRIYRKEAGGKWKKLASVAKTSYTDQTAKAGVLYHYTVRAFAKNAESGQNSKGIAGLFLPKTTITAAKNTEKQIFLQWKRVGSASGYRVYRRNRNEKKWTKLADVTNVFSYYDASVKAGTAYDYLILAYKKINKTYYFGYKNEKNAVSAVHLREPSLLQTLSKSGGVTLQWKKTKGAKSYRVYRRVGTTGVWNYLGSTKETTYVDKKAVSGKKYHYTVAAQNGESRSVLGKRSLTGVYLKRAVVTKVINQKKSVRLTWNAVKGAAAYRVYRRVRGQSWVRIASSVNKTSFTDSAVKDGKLYEYGVKAYKIVNGQYIFSEMRKADLGAVVRLAVPQTSVELNEQKGITVSWVPVSGAEKYLIYRKGPGESWKKRGTSKKTSFADKTVPEGIEYLYMVKAVNGNSLSAFTASAKIKIPADLDLPEQRYLDLGWDVDPRRTGGPVLYCSNSKLVNKTYWTNHFTYGGDTYKPKAGDIITYGIPDGEGNTQEHVDICVSGYNAKTGTFGVISGNYGSWWQTSAIAYAEQSWKTYSNQNYYRTICNIWECKLPTTKKNALINTAKRMLAEYQTSPELVRGKILDAMYNPTNWCDAFVAYTIYIARY